MVGTCIGDEYDLSFKTAALDTNVGLRDLIETDTLSDAGFDCATL